MFFLGGKEASSSRGIVVFVSYYPNYYNESICRLERMAKRCFGENYVVLVVANRSISNEAPFIKKDNYYYITGTNSSWEFSAWDEGVKYIQEHLSPKDDDIVVLGNDTFCHHRVFTRFDEYCFSRAVLHELPSDVVVGFVDKSAHVLSVNGQDLDHWVSTFLFATRYDVVNNALPFSVCDIDDISYSNDKIIVSGCSKVFNDYLTSWLVKGWYKKDDADKGLVISKAKAIVNEKSFSARLIKKNVSLVNVYSGNHLPLIRKVLVKLGVMLK